MATMKTLLRNSAGLVGVGFVAGSALALSAGIASANYEWYLGSICKPQIGDTVNPVDMSYAFENPVTIAGTWLAHNETTQGNFACPMPDETGLSLGTITTAQAEIYDGSDAAGVHGKVCAMYQSAAGAVTDDVPPINGHACGFTGATSSISGRGNAVLAMNTIEGGQPALQDWEIGYVWLKLPGKQSGFNASRVFRLAFYN